MIHTNDNSWTERATKWEPKICKRNHGKQRIRWIDSFVVFVGARRSTLTLDRDVEEVAVD